MGRRRSEPRKIPVIVEYTEGYEKRFTEAIMKIYEKRMRAEEANGTDNGREVYSCVPQYQQVRVS